MEQKINDDQLDQGETTEKNPKENLESLFEWLKVDPEVPTFVKNEKSSLKDDRYDGGRNRHSRVFTNSNHSYRNGRNTEKTKETHSNSENQNVPWGYEDSWDRSIRKNEYDKNKVYITDTKSSFYMAIKGSKSARKDSKCTHNIVHSHCNCTSKCTLGVCTNCFVVFCNSPCLKMGLSNGGKVELSSRSYLEGSFGLSESRMSRSTNDTEGSKSINSGSRSSSSKSSSLSTETATSPLANGRGRGKVSSPQEKYHSTNSIVQSDTGIFRRTHGYQQSFQARQEHLHVSRSQSMQSDLFSTREPLFELGRQGHFENASMQNGIKSNDLNIGYGISRGRGIDINSDLFGQSQSQSLGLGRGRGAFRFDQDKILRDPVGMFYGNNNAEPPLHRGIGRASSSKNTTLSESSAKIHNKTKITSNKPQKGSNKAYPDKNETDEIPEEAKEIEFELKRILCIEREEDKSSGRNDAAALTRSSTSVLSTLSLESEKPTHEDNLIETRSEMLSNGVPIRQTRRPTPIFEVETFSPAVDHEMDVPMGVKTAMKLTHVESENVMYFTWERGVASLDQLKVDGEKVRNGREYGNLKAGQYCLVYHNGDIINGPGFQRGLIVHVGNGETLLQLVDLGPVLTFDSSDVFPLPKKYYSIKRCAFRFGLKRASRSVEKDRTIRRLETLLGTEKIFVFVSHVATKTDIDAKYWGDICFADYPDADFAQSLVSAGLAEEIYDSKDFNNPAEFTCVESSELAAKPISLLGGSKHPVKICRGAKGLDDFFIRKNEDEEKWNKIRELTKRAVSLGLNPYHPWLSDSSCYGSICMTKPADRKYYYRARVLYIDTGLLVTVQLLDTGEYCTSPVDEVLEMPSQLRVYEPLAYHCKLPLTLKQGWTIHFENQFYRLNEIHAVGNGLVAKVFSRDEDSFIIDLKLVTEGTSLCAAFPATGLAALYCDEDVRAKIDREIGNSLYLKDSERFAAVAMNWDQTAENQGFPIENSSEICDMLIANNDTSLNVQDDNSVYQYDQLKQLPPISELKGKICLFNHLIGFNIFTVMEKANGLPLLSELQEKITDWTKSGQGCFEPEKLPKKNEVVLAPFGKSKYRRAKVIEVVEQAGVNMARIRFIDYGTAMTIPVSLLKKPNKDIMQVPLFVHYVQLENVKHDAPILIQHFRVLRLKLMGEIIMGPHIPDPEESLPFVYMFDTVNDQRLSTLINDLAIWNWRKHYRVMYTKFEEQLLVQPWPFESVEGFFLDRTITETMKRATLDMKIRIVVATPSRIFVSGIPIDSTVTYQSRTLCAQMTMYMEKMSTHPMTWHEIRNYEHLVGVLLSETRVKNDKYPTLCTWHRCYYNGNSETVNCMDCFWSTTQEKDPELIMRPLTPDFYEASPTGLTVAIDVSEDEDASMLELKCKKLFPVGKTINVNIRSRVPIVENKTVFYQAVLIR